MTGELLLVVEDDLEIARVLRVMLEAAGYSVLATRDGQEALKLIYDRKPALLVLDIRLEGSKLDGWTVCQRVREYSTMPIIMVTGEQEPDSIVRGLDAGADDYILKPFNREVLLARVRANLRRAGAEPILMRSPITYADDFLSINLDERRVTRDGQLVKLTPIEFNMLSKLLQSAPRFVTYQDLLESVWGFEYRDDVDYLRVYVWHLRRKLEKDPKQPTYIINEQGVGYKFEKVE